MISRWTLAVVLTGIWCGAAPLTWYVAPDGDDAWTGMLSVPNATKTDGPFATLAAARDASRKQAGQPRRIELTEGRFFLGETLALDARDSKLTIEGAGIGKTIVYGGRQLHGWQRDSESLWSVNLPADRPAWSFRVLVVNDALADRARLPEGGYFEHETKFPVRWMSTAGGGWERKPTEEERTTMRYRAGDVPADLRVENAEVTVCHMWDESTVGVAGNDPETRTLTFSSPCGHPPGAFRVQRYVIWNTREGMTRAGQWYLDRVARKLYYWPRKGEDVSEAVVVAPTMETLIKVVGGKKKPVDGITIRGITLSAGDAPLKPAGFGASRWDGALHFVYADRVKIDAVEVVNCGVWGVREWGGKEFSLTQSRLHHLGGGGIKFGGGAHIEGNDIHHIGLISASAIGIMGGGLKAVVRRNVIYDNPYSGMCVSGTETVIEENLIYRCMLVHHDGAAIYMGGGKRCIIRRNLARDMAQVGKGYGVSAYYLDEKCRGCIVSDNIAMNIPHPSQNHMTLDCELRDNVFIHDGDMKIAFSRCSGHKITGNTFHVGGKLRIHEPDAIAVWENNRILTTGDAGGRIADDVPRKPFKPREKPRYVKPKAIDPAPTIDGLMSPDEWPTGGTSLGERTTQRRTRGAPTSVKIHADDTHLYILTNVVTMFPDQRRLGTEWGKDEGIELVLEAQEGDASVVHVLRGFSEGSYAGHCVAGASVEQAAVFAKRVRYGASLDKKIWRSEWAVPLSALGVDVGQKKVVPFNLTVYRSEDDVFAQYAGTLGETWDLGHGGRLMLNWDGANPQAPKLAVATIAVAPSGAKWPGEPVQLAQTPGSVPLSAPPCSAKVLRHGDNLHVRVVVPVKAVEGITRGSTWCTDDGAEVCIEGKTPDGKRAVWIIHGFACGTFELSDEAGIPAAANAAMRSKVSFTALITAAGWRGEWRLPLKALGVKTTGPVPFNLGVFRSEDRQWINWKGTNGPTWKLERAGCLTFGTRLAR